MSEDFPPPDTDQNGIHATTAQRLQLIRAGYAPIPLYGKEPPVYKTKGKYGNNEHGGLTGWQTMHAVTPEQVRMWEKTWPDAYGTGLLSRSVPAGDIEILNPEAADAIEALAREHFEERGYMLFRLGMAPKRAFLLRTDTTFNKLTSIVFDAVCHNNRIGIRGRGLLAALGMHPALGTTRGLAGSPAGCARTYPMAPKRMTRVLDEPRLLITEYGYSLADPKREQRQKGNGHDQGEAWSFAAEARMREALAHIPANEAALTAKLGDSHSAFVNIGRAIERLDWGERGFNILRDWCSQSPKFDPAGLQTQWNSFARTRGHANPVTIGTVFHYAKQFGWSEQRDGMAAQPSEGLGEWDAGEVDDDNIPPRGWLRGTSSAAGLSSILGDGGVGKTATRYAQLLSLACGRSLTGEHVFQRSRVMMISLEDEDKELRRRIRAVRLHHGVEREELKGWLFVAAPGLKAGKILTAGKDGQLVTAGLAAKIEKIVTERRIDIVSLDPFVKAHAVSENDNNAIDAVVQILTEMAVRHDIAVDIPHHISKGLADPGNANRGRGASAMKDAARLVYTLTSMTPEEGRSLGLDETLRRHLVRMDSGKVNIAPPMTEAKWFRLVGIALGNATEMYPAGDTVQTVEPWIPPDKWAGLTHHLLNQMLNDIDAGLPDGNRYSDHYNAGERAAWKVIVKHAPQKPEAEAKQIVKAWLKTGLLYPVEYDNPATRKPVKGLSVDNSKRPS